MFLATFNLPNFNYKSVWQDPQYVGMSTIGELPNITGEIAIGYGVKGTAVFSGKAFSTGQNVCNIQAAATQNASKSTVFDASRSSVVYNSKQTQVVPASVFILFCIKY